MIKDIVYNPDREFVFSNREEILKCFKESFSEDVYNAYKDAKVSDVFKKLDEGVYEFYDVNTPDNVIDPSQNLIDYEIMENGFYHSFPYGVCDNYKQIIERDEDAIACINSDDHFIIVLCKISKKDQPDVGGWRWHKWGKYIGDQHPMCEYIADEPEIDFVYVYNLYKVEKK
jgi:hypothetical protein